MRQGRGQGEYEGGIVVGGWEEGRRGGVSWQRTRDGLRSTAEGHGGRIYITRREKESEESRSG